MDRQNTCTNLNISPEIAQAWLACEKQLEKQVDN